MRSRVDGDWNGWDGDTIVKLENGTVWRQDQYYYRYKYKHRPRVTVEANKMTVEGIDKAVRVRRID